MRDHPLRLTLPYAIVSPFIVTERLVLWRLTSGEQPPMALEIALGYGTPSASKATRS